MKPNKTRICHTLNSDGQFGFDFLLPRPYLRGEQVYSQEIHEGFQNYYQPSAAAIKRQSRKLGGGKITQQHLKLLCSITSTRLFVVGQLTILPNAAEAYSQTSCCIKS